MINKFNELFEVTPEDTMTKAITKGLVKGYIQGTVGSAIGIGSVIIGLAVIGHIVETNKEIKELEEEIDELKTVDEIVADAFKDANLAATIGAKGVTF